MIRINMHISNVKLPFYPPCEVKYGLQNRVSTVLWVWEVYDPTHALSRLRARAEEVVCRGRMIEGRGVKGNS